MVRIFTRSITFGLLLLPFLFIDMQSQAWTTNDNSTNRQFNIYDVKKSFSDYWTGKTPGKGQGWKAFKRLEYFWEQRLYPEGNLPDASTILSVYSDISSKRSKNDIMTAAADWKPLGPTNKPQKANSIPAPGTGRINCIAFDPNSANVLWAGAASGGVWKSTNGGTSWTTFPFTEFLSIGISDIAISPSDPNTVYVATGDADAGGVFGQNFCFSIGVLKTTNGGNSWSQTNLTAQIPEGMLINRLLVHPANANLVYAATNTGIMVTSNGGQAWTRISTEKCRDMEFKPNDPTTIYCAFVDGFSYSIKKYNATSNTFTKLRDFSSIYRMCLTVSKAAQNNIYALACRMDGGFDSFWRSTDSGQNWTKMADGSSSPNYLSSDYNGNGSGGQGYYDLCLAVSPTNANEVYLGGVNLWKSTNGGKDWTINAEWTGYYGVPWVHADHHALEFNNNILYSTNDGGIQKTTNGGQSWTDLSNGLQITQFYRINSSFSNASIIVGGTQDNGTFKLESGSWEHITGGDGMECAIDYSNPDIIYSSIYYGTFHRSLNGGNTQIEIFNKQKSNEDADWIAPFAMHPSNSSVLFAGHKNVWKSTDKGDTWKKISNFTNNMPLKYIAVAPTNPDYIYAASWGSLYATQNGGTSWKQIHTANAVITGICVDPASHGRIWITLSGYNAGVKVYAYDNAQWTNFSDSLPNVPVNCIVYQKNSPDRLYVGTDIGVFYRDKGTHGWRQFNDGLPNVVVNDLDIHYGSGKLRAATYGRGLWETKINDCNIESPVLNQKGSISICEGESITLECQGSFKSYLWSTGEKSKSIVVNESGTYTLTVTDDKGCSATSEKVNINVEVAPAIAIKAVTSNTLCEGDSIQLSTGFGFATVEWSNGATEKKIWVKEPGTLTVTGTTQNGCKRTSAPFVVKMNPAPEKPTVVQSGLELVASDAENYQWYCDKVIIDGATSKKYLPLKPGKYMVSVKNSFDCKSYSDEFDYTTSVADNTEGIIAVFPNPFSNVLEISAKEVLTGKVRITINDLLGKKLMEIDEISGAALFRKQLDLTGLSRGMYILSVFNGDKTYSMRIVKE